MRQNAVKNRLQKHIKKHIGNMLKNDSQMRSILVKKTSKKEEKRLPKWDPLEKTPKGGQMEPKWLQNELKMEPILIENASRMLPK